MRAALVGHLPLDRQPPDPPPLPRASGSTESFSVLDRGDAADLIDLVRHELGFSKAEKRFPRKDTCLAIYSHRVNTQRPLAKRCRRCSPGAREWEDAAHGLFAAYVETEARESARSTTTTCCSTGTR